MPIKIITPALSVSDLTVAKAHCNVDFDDDDALIGDYVEAAYDLIEGPEGYLGRFIRPQTVEWSASCFSEGMVIDMTPIIDLIQIKYYDASNALVTLPATGYFTGPTTSGYSVLWSVDGFDWPATYKRHDAVIFEARVGYKKLPPKVKLAVNLMVADWYDARGSLTDERFAVPQAAEKLLAPLRTNIVGADAGMRAGSGV